MNSINTNSNIFTNSPNIRNAQDYEGEIDEKLSEAKTICWNMLSTGICDCCRPENIINSKLLTGGLSNILIKVEILREKLCDDMKKANERILNSDLKVRFYARERKIFVNEKREELIQQLIAKYEIGKPVLFYFDGGQVEEFIEGKTLEVEDVRKKSVYLSIAKKIAQLHSIQITPEIIENIRGDFKCKNYRRQCENALIEKEKLREPISILWPTLENWLTRVEEIIQNDEFFKKIDINKLRKLIYKLKKHLYSYSSKSKVCSIVLSHSDLLPGNIIETLDKNHIFIDYEFSGTMERAFDIGNHLCEWAGLDCEWNFLPDDQTLSDFLSTYISYSPDYHNLIIKSESENCFCLNQETSSFQLNFSNSNNILMEDYINSVKVFMVISNIFWGLWALCKSDLKRCNLSCHFDYKSYGYRKLESINNETYFRNILKNVDPLVEFPIF